VDVANVMNYCRSGETRALKGVLGPAEAKEVEKVRKYAYRLAADEQFIPFVMELGGGLGKRASKWLKAVQREMEDFTEFPCDTVIANLRCDIALTQRKAYLQLMSERRRKLLRRRTRPPGFGG
jgi:hypothetical protein